VKTHSVSLCNLFPGTEYYFVIKSDDRSENSAESSEYSFTTTGVPNNPIISISTDKYEYTTCETMNITIGLKNPTENAQQAWFVWYLGLPDYNYWLKIMGTQISLPPNFDYSVSIPMHIGDWGGYSFNASWYVALLNTTTSKTISEDTASWKYVPNKMAKSETIPEEIARDVESKILLEKTFPEHFLLEKEPALRKILTVINET
jgi:hypothetical protein